MKRTSVILALALGCASAAWAQQPLSAIDWLDRQATVPVARPLAPDEPPVTNSADIPGVEVTQLGKSHPDSVGLLPSASTGLPRSLWQASETSDLTALLKRADPEALPAIRALFYTLLLAEADAPLGTGADAAFLKARVHSLVRFGAVDPARALLERAGPDTPALFDTWLGLTLLSGDEDQACTMLRKRPALSSDYAARVYCTARAGDWNTAALTFETAHALGALEANEAELLAQFLDPELVGTSPQLAPPRTLSPLVFRLYEAVGAPLPTGGLPRAFAMTDLRGVSGWKAEIEAAERLTRTGALPATRLLGLYTERKPAASGGVWDRVAAIQAFDNALFRRDPAKVAETLPDAWQTARSQGLEVPFAQMFASALADLELPAELHDLAFRIALLSDAYESAAARFGPATRRERLLAGLAQGAPDMTEAQSPLERAIVAGFATGGAAPSHMPLLEAGKLGEAILTAGLQMGTGQPGSAPDITAAIATLRAVGLEDTARRAALQLLILGEAA